jgi:hypothetical protein
MIERLEIARVIVKELLRQAGVFEMESLSGHNRLQDSFPSQNHPVCQKKGGSLS